MPSIDEIYVEVKLIRDQVKKDLEKMQDDAEQKVKQIENKLKFKARFDGSLVKLNIDQLKAYREKLQKVFEQKLTANVDASSLNRTKAQIKSIDDELAKVTDTSNKLPGIFRSIGAAIGVAFTVQQIAKFGFEAVKLAAKAEGVERAFNNLNQPGLLDDLRRATRGTVSDLELMQVTMRAANFKIPLTELATYLEFAQKRATMTGQEVDYLVNSIIDGIGRKSTLVLDNLGISASELQTELKKTGDFGKAAANIIAREMEGMGDVVGTTADEMARLNAEIENQKVKLGKDIQPLWYGTLKLLGLVVGGLEIFRRGLLEMIGVHSQYNEKLTESIERHQQYAKMLVTTYGEQKKLAALIVSTYKQALDTTKGDEILENYKKEKNEIEQIRNKLKDTKLTQEERNILTKELNSYLEKNKTSLSEEAKYLKDTLSSLDQYRNKIKLLQTELSKLGSGDTEKKLLLQANIEDLQKQLNSAEIKIGLKVTDIDFDAGSIDESELTKQIEGTILSSIKAQQEANDERGKVIDKFYSSTKNKDEEYVKWRLRKIAEETLAIQEATGDQILAKKYQVEQQKELEDDYFEYSINKWREQNKTASIAISAMTDAFAEGLQQIQIRTKENATILEKIFVDMANSFIRQVARMIAEWMAFQALKGIAATLLAPVTGGASLAAAALREGGEVVRGKKVKSYSQIPKFATGTEFNVPAKYTNDSFLMRVSANERVRVTPANRVGDTDRLLSGIQNSLDVLNKNLINKDFAPVINTRLDIDGRRIARQINSITERMQKEGQ